MTSEPREFEEFAASPSRSRSLATICSCPPITANGNKYWHDLSRKDIENGNPVWVNICETELRNEWNRRSSIKYDSTDNKGQELRYTLIRYLASKGLMKDSAGFSVLTTKDIKNVENGITNAMFVRWPGIKIKMYELIWQIDYYCKGGNPSGHSITQRLEFMKTGWHVFMRFPLFGTGTGDIADEFMKQYSIDKSLLDNDHRFLSHNQFITFLAAFGITGFLLIIILLFTPLIISPGWRHFIPVTFIVIIFLSMFWEDTLQTHTGVSFFAYFYSLFIFGTEDYEKGSQHW